MNAGQCIITGCDLVNERGQCVSGDLFKVGEAWVFNAACNVHGVPSWGVRDPRNLHIRPLRPWWQRRAVFVFEGLRAEEMSVDALEYISNALTK